MSTKNSIKNLPFEKYHACGNDFMMINRDLIKDETILESLSVKGQQNSAFSQWVKDLCSSHLGVGADGIIFYQIKPLEQSIFVEIANSDGTMADFCANGTRCAFHVSMKECLSKQTISKEQTQLPWTMVTRAGAYQAYFKEDEVTLSCPSDHFYQWKVEAPLISLSDYQGRISSFEEVMGVQSGVPHLYYFVTPDHYAKEMTPNQINFRSWAKIARHHQVLAPAGSNVNLVSLIEETKEKRIFHQATFERGVEDLTLSCGSGILGLAWIYKDKDLEIHCQGGVLKASYNKKTSTIEYSGLVTPLFSAQLY